MRPFIPLLILSTLSPLSAAAQNLDLQVDVVQDTLTVEITGAAPSSAVALGIDLMVCSGDVDGDRATTAADILAIQAAYGPVHGAADKIFDQNNDGFINEQDEEEIQPGMGCSDPQSIPIPGCNVTASLNPNKTFLTTVATNAAGTGTFSFPFKGNFDANLYFQAIDLGTCDITELKPFRVLGSAVYVSPRSTITAVVRSDFFEPVYTGLVRLESDLDGRTFPKTANSQTDGLLDVSPGATARIIVGETPAQFTDDSGNVLTGVALGLIDETTMPEHHLSTGRLFSTVQPFAVETLIGAGNTIAPFHGLYNILINQAVFYQPFKAKVAVLPTRSQTEDVLAYYDVAPEMLEFADTAVVIRVENKVDLNKGPTAQHGFRILLKNYTGYTSTPYVATRYLAQTLPSSDANVAKATVATFDQKTTAVHVTGRLEAGDHLILLSSRPFAQESDFFLTNPPVLSAASEMTNGTPCGTPPPPANPPAVGGGLCVAGLPLLSYLDDCVITNNYWVSGTACATVGPFLLTTSGGGPGFKIEKNLETDYTGSANVGVTISGVNIGVGQEISHTEGIITDITIQPGVNGCGQNLAWYLYEKYCVTLYKIRYHTWEGWLPDWCGGCCFTVRPICKAGETILAEVCDRDC